MRNNLQRIQRIASSLDLTFTGSKQFNAYKREWLRYIRVQLDYVNKNPTQLLSNG